ncbi:NAD(P)-binding domain-containing protein [candidate division KSB1 bacterium]|nr:NAD(P)-binding domain-containing protein [candidate division KSB1 bacterium]
MSQRIAILGAGPIGLEAALYASQLGYKVEIFEQGEVGANMLDWGHVRLFTRFKMNHSSLGVISIKRESPNWQEPDGEGYMTGREFVDSYLVPLSQLSALKKKINTGMKVVSIGRENILKGELIGDSKRPSYPFRILTENAHGEEQIHTADIVIDSTGVYNNPNWLGDGGIPALGELKSKPFINYQMPDVYGKDRSKFAGKKSLVMGAGYSAATVVCDFQNLIREEPATSLIWAIRGSRSQPIPLIQDDPLPSRAGLTKQANSILQDAGEIIQFRNNTIADSIEYFENKSAFSVGLKSNGQVEQIEVDRVIATVGYGPDNSIYRELQIHECYASRGPMKLAAALLGASSADCLAQESAGADTLKNPEPNFFIIGNKSYGRNPTFLIRMGLSQIVEIFSLISGDEKLNLYQTESEGAVA